MAPSRYMKFWKKNQGASLVSYMMLVGLVALIALVSIGLLGHKVSSIFGNASNHLNNIAIGDGNPTSDTNPVITSSSGFLNGLGLTDVSDISAQGSTILNATSPANLSINGWSLENAPSWLSISNIGVLTGMPNGLIFNDCPGTCSSSLSFNAVAIDSQGHSSASKTFDFSIQHMSPAVVASGTPAATASVGSAYDGANFTASTFSDANVVTWTSSPDITAYGLVLTSSGTKNENLAITGTPTSELTSTSISVTATDSIGAIGTNSFNLTITAPTCSSTPVTYNTAGIQNITVPADCGHAKIQSWGAGGGGAWVLTSTNNTLPGSGGAGGYVEGQMSVTSGQSLTVVVGGGGLLSPQITTTPTAGTALYATGTNAIGGGGAAGTIRCRLGVGSCSGGNNDRQAQGGGGGGYSGIFTGTPSQGTALLVAAGGGGGGASDATTTVLVGGAGSWNGAAAGGKGLRAGGGATQSNGGAAGTAGGIAGSALAGGDVRSISGSIEGGAGAGGGGYYGGGSGGSWEAAGSGGGGSGYTAPSVTSVVHNDGSGRTAPNTADTNYVSGAGTGGLDGRTAGATGTQGGGIAPNAAINGGTGLVVITYTP